MNTEELIAKDLFPYFGGEEDLLELLTGTYKSMLARYLEKHADWDIFEDVNSRDLINCCAGARLVLDIYDSKDAANRVIDAIIENNIDVIRGAVEEMQRMGDQEEQDRFYEMTNKVEL